VKGGEKGAPGDTYKKVAVKKKVPFWGKRRGRGEGEGESMLSALISKLGKEGSMYGMGTCVVSAPYLEKKGGEYESAERSRSKK